MSNFCKAWRGGRTGLNQRRRFAGFPAGAACWLALALLAAVRGNEPIEFNRDIRPILSENCFACHGPDKGKRKAGLRLDRREEATSKLDSGDRAIVPHEPGQSKLLEVLTAADEKDRMPPKKTGKHLTKAQVDLLREWIAQGAPWQEHWAYLPPKKAPVPETRLKGWAQNEIDSFVLQRLEKEGLQPSPKAEKQTLLRRATLDLTGLPPTLEEVDAYLADTSPEAYEKVVDRLLGASTFGERFAQWWLDLARYADSDGYHADVPRSMWQYRDYVIQSFNANKRFDQFTIEQLAGDLLPNATLEQRIATAFNRNGMSSTEGGADPDEYMNKYVTDRVNTFGTVFLGSSIACTECHDHKYDQFTQREYYQLYDFFNQIPERGLDSDPAPPFVKVPTAEQTAALEQRKKETAALEERRKSLLEKTDSSADEAQARWEQQQRQRIHSGWQVLAPVPANGVQKGEDGSFAAGGEKKTIELTFRAPQREIGAIRLQILPPESGAKEASFSLNALEITAESADPASEAADFEWGAWSVLGAFKAGSAKEIFEKAFIDETTVDLAKTYDEGRLKWTGAPGLKDDAPQPLWGENSASYFYRTIQVSSARYAWLALGSDGGLQAWVNGARAHEGVLHGTASKPDKLLVKLKAGLNTVLLKAHHGSGAGGFFFGRPAGPALQYPVAIATALADQQEKDHPASAAIDDKAETGWSVKLGPARHEIILAPKSPILFASGARLTVRLTIEGSSRVRLAVTERANGWDEIAALPPSVQTALFASPDSSTPGERSELRDYYRDHVLPEGAATSEKLAAARKAEGDLYASIPTIRVMEDMTTPRETHIRVRGDYRNLGEAVKAGTPHSLPPLSATTERTNRLALARWLTDPNHPLLSRVTVNRFWALYFGTGFVLTGNEFGTQGEAPSHPELLDWLARDFIDGGWNVKALQKKILMSATYQQSSKVSPELVAQDPKNRLLARGPRLRLTAEMIRDCALDYAGLLDRKRPPGGPSVKPYQPAGLWEEKMFGGNRYEESKGADLYRRSLYTLWKRTVLNPTLMTFDAPDRALCTEQRSITCTPLQAFVTLNEKGYVEAARVFAERILRQGGDDPEKQLDFACKTVLARAPSEPERKILRSVHDDMLAAHQQDLKGALELISTGEYRRAENVNELELAAWTGVANVLLNLDEAVTKE